MRERGVRERNERERERERGDLVGENVWQISNY